MKTPIFLIALIALVAPLAAACDDDEASEHHDDHDHDAATATLDGGNDAGSEDPLYLIGSSVQSSDESTLLLWTAPKLTGLDLELSQAQPIVGGNEAVSFDDAVFVTNSETKTITRFEVNGDELVAGKELNLSDQGMMYVGYSNTILNSERAFLVNDAQLEMLEWNPTTMTITKTHDFSKLARKGWGQEYRGGFVRKSDGVFFFYWTYTNERTEFVNDFVLGVFDSKTDTLSVQVNEECPATAGFGGFFDEKEDLYLIADSFGLFTQYQYEGAKPACVLRVKKDSTEIDPDYRFIPADAMDGRAPWGLYYLADGLAYTSAVAPESFDKYDSVFELLFAPVHTGWLLDLAKSTAKQITDLPPDGVGFESHHVDGRLLVPRTTGSVVIEDIMSTESTLFDIKPDASATKLFSLPGYIAPVMRIR